MSPRRPSLAVWKFTSCDGCQLTLTDCEDDLLAIAGSVDIAYFPELSSTSVDGPYDLSLVEGSVTTAAERALVQEVRARSRQLVTIGACATSGGIQALRNARGVAEYLAVVYARPDVIDALDTSTGIAQHVDVDLELRGCPIDRGQLLEVISAVLAGRRPALAGHSVCVDCKAVGRTCVLVTGGGACLGPVTQTGCGALCPAYGRGCFGCFGPAETGVVVPLGRRLRDDGVPADEVDRLLSLFGSGEPGFERAAR